MIASIRAAHSLSKSTVAICLSALLPAASSVLAQTSNDDSYAVTGNVAVVSDYDFRGLTQTWGAPAINGGGDLVMKNGFAAGFWASSISQKTYPGAALELDRYASYGNSFNHDWSWRAGLYGYVYPQGNLNKVGLRSRSFNTLEGNIALTWKWLSLKYSSSANDYFGIDTEQGYRTDSKGTGYLQLDAAIPFNEKWSLALHAAHTAISTELITALPNGSRSPDYSDFGATLKYQFATHWSASAGALHATNDAFYARTASFQNAADTRNVGGTRGFVMLQGNL